MTLWISEPDLVCDDVCGNLKQTRLVIRSKQNPLWIFDCAGSNVLSSGGFGCVHAKNDPRSGQLYSEGLFSQQGISAKLRRVSGSLCDSFLNSAARKW